MKKVLCILCCFIYLVSSAGINIELHYCGGKIKTISFSHSDEKDCCGTKMKKDCCKEKSLSYKVKDDQNAGIKVLSAKPFKVEAFMQANVQFFHFYFSRKAKLPADDRPPGFSEKSLFLLNRVFRI